MENEIYTKKLSLKCGAGSGDAMNVVVTLTSEVNCYLIWIEVEEACFRGALYAGVDQNMAIEAMASLCEKFSAGSDWDLSDFICEHGFSVTFILKLEEGDL